MKEAAAKAAYAKVRVMMAGGDEMREIRLAPAEFACLRSVVGRTAANAPALETDERSIPELRYFMELVFVDARGTELSGVCLNTEPWMRRSDAQKMTRTRKRSCQTPDWNLPDADYELYRSLPSIAAARTWAQTRLR